MLAVVLKANGRVELEERSMPKTGEGEYLLKIIGAGICSSDIFRAFSNGSYFYPIVMGHEFTGKIVDIGPGAYKYKRGQKVTVFPLNPCGKCKSCLGKKWVYCEDYGYYGSRTDGAFQEYLNVKEWNLVPLSEESNPIMASLCEPIAVCFRAVSKCVSDWDGEELAVIGGGFIGLVVAMILKEDHGFRDIMIIDRNRFKLNLAEEMGLRTKLFSEGLNYENKFGYVVEACGAVSAYQMAIKLANANATVILIGNPQGNANLLKGDVSNILRKELTIRGVWNSDYQGGGNDDWAKALKLIDSSLWLNKLVTHNITLEELPGMIEHMHRIKVKGVPNNILKVIVHNR